MSPEPGRRPPEPPAFRAAGAEAAARAVLIALAACLALRAGAAFVSSNWLWGLDTFRAWPLPAAVALAACAAAGFVPPIARALGHALERAGAAWERRRAIGDAMAAGTVFAVVFALRDPVLFVGDSALRAGALSLDVPMARLFPQAFPLDLALNIGLARGLAATGLGPLAALQLVGAALAAFFTLASLAFLRAIEARGASLPAAALVLLGGGYLSHFAGYDKYGPLLVGFALAAAGAARLARDGKGAWTLALGTVVSLLATRLGYSILPPALLAFVLAWRRGTHRASVAGAAGVTLAVALAMLPRTLSILLGFDARVHAPGGAVARALETPGAPDLLLRLSDTVNLFFFLAPIWPAGVLALAGIRGLRARLGGRGAVAALALALQLAIALGIRARQGVARDWDAYAGAGLVLSLVVTGALALHWRARGARRAGGAGVPATMPAAVTVSLACAVALWGLHASEPMALRRIEARLAARPAWSESARAAALDHLGLRALRLSRFEEAAGRFESASAVAPNPRFFYQAGLAHLEAGRLDRAEVSFREANRRYRRIADPWIGLARVSLARGDTAGAATCLDSALARDPRHPEAAGLRRALPGPPPAP